MTLQKYELLKTLPKPSFLLYETGDVIAMLVSTQDQKGLEQKIFCKQMLVKFVIYISPCQYAEFMAAQTVQSGKAYYREGI